MNLPTSKDDAKLKCAKEHTKDIEKLSAYYKENIGNKVDATLALKYRNDKKTHVKGVIKGVYRTYFTIETTQSRIETIQWHDITRGKAKVSIV